MLLTNHQRRKGQLVSMELILLSPVILAAALAMIQFSMILAMQARLASASREGARAAALGGTPDEVRDSIKRVMGEKLFAHTRVHVEPEFSERNPLQTGQPVLVRVQIKVEKAFPDLLSVVGVRLGDHELTGQTVMRVE